MKQPNVCKYVCTVVNHYLLHLNMLLCRYDDSEAVLFSLHISNFGEVKRRSATLSLWKWFFGMGSREKSLHQPQPARCEPFSGLRQRNANENPELKALLDCESFSLSNSAQNGYQEQSWKVNMARMIVTSPTKC